MLIFSFWLILFTWVAGVLLTVRLKKRSEIETVPVPVPVEVTRLNDVFF
jgi:hypothetical protein